MCFICKKYKLHKTQTKLIKLTQSPSHLNFCRMFIIIAIISKPLPLPSMDTQTLGLIESWN